jgi:hypothetical protein
MLYALTIFLHSWLRWIVLAAGVVLLVRTAEGTARKRAWRPLDQRAGAAFLSALDLQVLVGLLLYFVVSPLTPKSFADLRAFMPVAPLRFFAVEHGTGMLIAMVAAHVGWVRGKRAPTDGARHRRVLVGVAVALLAILASIPWPWLSYGRDLVRGL